MVIPYSCIPYCTNPLTFFNACFDQINLCYYWNSSSLPVFISEWLLQFLLWMKPFSFSTIFKSISNKVLKMDLKMVENCKISLRTKTITVLQRILTKSHNGRQSMND